MIAMRKWRNESGNTQGLWTGNQMPQSLLRQQAKLIYARRPQMVHHIHQRSISYSGIGSDVNGSVRVRGQFVLYFVGESLVADHLATQEDCSVMHHGNHQCVFPVYVE